MNIPEMQFRSISTLLIQRIVGLAAVSFMLLGGMHAWFEYHRTKEHFERSMQMMAVNSEQNLANAIWDIDRDVVNKHVLWLSGLPEIAYVKVHAQITGQSFEAGEEMPSTPATVALPIMPPDGQAMPLGRLELWSDSSFFFKLMAESTLRILLGYVLLTLSICLLVAWVMRRELRKPLSQIARFAAALKPNELGTPLKLERPLRKQSDEIDLVIQGFAQLQGDLRRYIDNLDQLVADRTQKLQLLVEEVQRLSMMDALTGAFNRRALEERLPAEIERSLRYERPLSVVFVDIDHFKSINDTYGHGVGDAVLREVAARLHSQLRSQVDWLARYGGEEFLVVMPETRVDDAGEIATRLAQRLRGQKVNVQGHDLSITASFGVAQLKDWETQSALLERADQMLYEAKHAGRDCVKVG